jgi:hypothetical protein
MQVRSRRASVLALLLLVTACGTPPHKEMADAQSAIDAARAAGAERDARAEFAAATNSLALARHAVDQRDYRLALNHALDSRERAQNAERLAGEAQKRFRADIERSIAEIKALVVQANGRLTTAEKSRLPRRVTTDARRTIATIDDDLQKADAAAQSQDFMAAQTMLAAVKQRISQVITRLDTALGAQNPRRRK